MLADRLTVFWISIGITFLLFLPLLGWKIDFWSHGFVRDAHGRRVERGKVRAMLQNAVAAIRRNGFGHVASVFILDGLLHRRLWAVDRFRWLSHFLMLVGFLALFALSVITGFFEEILHGFFGVEGPAVEFITNKNTPLMAVLNESFGLLILIGLLLVLVRRFILRPAQLRTAALDVSTLVLLALIMLTSYPTEAFRLLMENTPPNMAWYSFLGYPLALLLRPLNWNWAIWHYWTFMLHIAACIALALYLPFSKFFHVFISPIIATANALRDEQEAHA